MVDFKENEQLNTLNHSCAHVMAQAIKHLYPQAKFWVGPVVAEGFYYDVDLGDEVVSDEAIAKIEKEMKKIIKEGNRLEKFTLPREEAIALMKEKEEPYKVELIEDLPEDAEISFYQQGEYIDLCAGPHLMNTKPLKAMKLISSSGGISAANSFSGCSTDSVAAGRSG